VAPRSYGALSALANFVQEGAGGIGAVSSGISEALLVALVACVVANRLLAGPARGSGGLVLRLHRAHSVTLVMGVAIVALLVLGLVLSLVPWITLTTAFLVIGILFGVQFLLFGAILIAFIWRRRKTPKAA
jgi:uncharacterized membrane protein HdeD (DUF308 family)